MTLHCTFFANVFSFNRDTFSNTQEIRLMPTQTLVKNPSPHIRSARADVVRGKREGRMVISELVNPPAEWSSD